MLGRTKREKEQSGTMTESQTNGNGAMVHKIEANAETLTLLEQGYQALMQKREQLTQQLAQCDTLIAEQRGGIHVLRQVLAGQEVTD